MKPDNNAAPAHFDATGADRRRRLEGLVLALLHVYSPPNTMIIRGRPRAIALLFVLRGSILPAVAARLCVVLLVACCVSAFYQVRSELFRHVTWGPFSLLGLALSIFLGFRNSATYDRWWEGRKQWGALIAEIRSLARDVVCVIEEAPRRERIAHRLIAFAHDLRDQLRGVDTGAWKDWISTEEQGRIGAARIRTDQILFAQSADLAEPVRRGDLSDIQFRLFSDRLAAITTAQASCERIHVTPAPFTYSLLLHRTAWLFCLFLPIGLVGTFGWGPPLAAMIVAYALFGLDELADELEEPFGETQNALPLNALVRNIEIAVLDAMGAADIPLPLQPQDHILL